MLAITTWWLAITTPTLHSPFSRPPVRRTATAPKLLTRRDLTVGFGCGCWASGASAANGLAALAPPSAELVKSYDLPRNKIADAGFALSMATGMGEYEKAVRSTKQDLFRRMFDGLPKKSDAVIVELGMGSFPNAPYYADYGAPLDIIGVDPNDSMETFALFAASPLRKAGSAVRVVHGVGEALPLPDRSADAVVCTLTLCSVPSPERTLAEVKRVLRPGGQFLFLEHVRSETNSKFAAYQDEANPNQVRFADGCNLNRRTLETIRAAGFAKVEAQYFDLPLNILIKPTVAGIAIA